MCTNALFYDLYTQFSLLFVGVRCQCLSVDSSSICIDDSHPGKQFFLSSISIAQNFQVDKSFIWKEIVTSEPPKFGIK